MAKLTEYTALYIYVYNIDGEKCAIAGEGLWAPEAITHPYRNVIAIITVG